MRRQRKRSFKLLALISGFTLFALAACGDDSDDEEAQPEDPDVEAPPEARGPEGGEITIGAEQWPQCLNPHTSCANAAWTRWSVTMHILPRLMELTPEDTYRPSPVLDGEPVLSGEGIDDSGDPFTVTYTIREDAVWDDGTPITSTDLRFTWLSRMNTTGAVSVAGFEEIADIDDSDPKVAVITWNGPYSAWATVMGAGGVNANFIKADAEYFGEDVVSSDEPDLADFMDETIPFSGGPWVLQSWTSEESVLVPNANYWEESQVPLLDQVTLIPTEDTATQITLLLAGDVDFIQTQPSPGISDEVGDMELFWDYSGSHENLWFILDSLLNPDSPLHDIEVRQALRHAVDRDRIVDEILGPDFPDASVMDCMRWAPGVGPWCDETTEYMSEVDYDPDESARILEAAGWEREGDGVWERDGEPLAFGWQTTAGNQRREDVQRLVIEELREQGWDIEVDNSEATVLFGERAFQRQVELMMYAWVAGPDPLVHASMHSENEPTEENEWSGQNWVSWKNDRADEVMDLATETLDEDELFELTAELGELMFEDAITIPLFQMPNVAAWDADRVTPVTAYMSTQDHSLRDLHDWHLPG